MVIIDLNTVITINVKEKEDVIYLEFINEGEKIPAYKLDKIFEKFYRGDSARSSSSWGSGLGFPITKEIVELHNGIIEVENESKYIIFLKKS